MMSSPNDILAKASSAVLSATFIFPVNSQAIQKYVPMLTGSMCKHCLLA